MSAPASHRDAAGLMDGIYRWQRHIYDATRKFYLLGRDGLIADLAVPSGGTVLEIGCGTGRNLVKIARAYPQARCYGLDVSSEMLVTARQSVARAGLSDWIVLAQADATGFDPQALFGHDGFDRIVISYALSMIPPWQGVVAQALRTVSPGGSLHIVDFGDQARLPGPFKAVLNRWLALFHVSPRLDMERVLAGAAAGRGFTVALERLHGGYSVRAVARRR